MDLRHLSKLTASNKRCTINFRTPTLVQYQPEHDKRLVTHAVVARVVAVENSPHNPSEGDVVLEVYRAFNLAEGLEAETLVPPQRMVVMSTRIESVQPPWEKVDDLKDRQEHN